MNHVHSKSPKQWSKILYFWSTVHFQKHFLLSKEIKENELDFLFLTELQTLRKFFTLTFLPHSFKLHTLNIDEFKKLMVPPLVSRPREESLQILTCTNINGFTQFGEFGRLLSEFGLLFASSLSLFFFFGIEIASVAFPSFLLHSRSDDKNANAVGASVRNTVLCLFSLIHIRRLNFVFSSLLGSLKAIDSVLNRFYDRSNS